MTDVDLGIDVERLAEICERYGVARLEILGSVARGQYESDNDIDLLDELLPGRRVGWEIEELATNWPACSAATWTQSPGGRSTHCSETRSGPRPGSGTRREAELVDEAIGPCGPAIDPSGLTATPGTSRATRRPRFGW